jgi:hypothetical protein
MPLQISESREFSLQHMDTKNDSRGGREERARESAILEVDASMSDKCHSVPDLGHERKVTPSSAIERTHGDAAGQGERVVSGVWRGGDT